MKKAFDDYRLIAHGGTGSVWEGPDHLLYIESAGFLLPFSETYKRLDYSKIQTISCGRTGQWTLTLLWTGVVGLLIAAGVIMNYRETAALVGLGVVGVPVLLIFLLNLAKGPTCVCKVQTAVQVLKLKPLTRLRPTLRAVARIRELCQFHQGGAPVSDEALIQATMSGLDRHDLPGAAKPPFPGLMLLTVGLPMMVVAGVLIIVQVFVKGTGMLLGAGFVSLIAFILCLSGLARGSKYELPSLLKFSLWGNAVNLALTFVAGYSMIGMASLMQIKNMAENAGKRGLRMTSEIDVWDWISHATLAELGFVGWMVIFTGALAILLGLLGMPSALRPPGARISVAPPSVQPPVSPQS